MMTLMQRFATRRFLKKKASLEFREDEGRPRLYCDEPAIVARFASVLRQAACLRFGTETTLLMRGQTKDYPGMVPGLFRSSAHSAERTRLAEAESLFECEIRQKIKLGRFKRPNLPALLQHYGYRTSWLDVVDTLWGAVWFATNSIEPRGVGIRSALPRKTGTGWIYFIAVNAQSSTCTGVDLRKAHHGLSLRPHTQNGWSIRAPGNVFDLNQWVVGCVEFPISDRWVLGGFLGSSAFLFPPAKLDDTLRRLIDKDVDDIAARIEVQLNLPDESLGRVYYLADDLVQRQVGHSA